MRTRPLRLVAVLLLLAGLGACDLDPTNPNAAREDQALGTAEGLKAAAVGMQDFYATQTLAATLLVPGVSGREVAVTTTLANLVNLEEGGRALPNSNADVLRLWSRNYRTLGTAEDLLESAPDVNLEGGTRSGLVALARLFKAMALGNLAQNFEQVALTTDREQPVPFAPRQRAFEQAAALLGQALAALDETPPSEEFRSDVLTPELDLRNTILAYRARYQLFAGHYDAALDAARAADPEATSVFSYDDLSRNPLYVQTSDAQLGYFAPRDRFGTQRVDAADGRLGFYLNAAPDSSAAGRYPIEALDGFGASASTPLPLYLPGELPLIRAEAKLRQGHLGAAVAEIDAVRTQAPGDAPLGVAAALAPYDGPVTKAALLEELFYQRRAELFLQGFGLADRRRLLDEEPEAPFGPFERTRTFYPYPQQERLNNPNTPADPPL